MAKVIKEVDWNGKHYTFTNTYKNTGAKSHDILTMTDNEGNSITGETTWINRPWHRFDLEEAFTQIVEKAFGPKAKELILKINEEVGSLDRAIDRFFSEFNPEDITSDTESNASDTSEEARKQALANFLDIDVEEIESDGDNEFSCDVGTYLVLTDSEADDAFDDSVRNLWDEMGLDSVSDSFRERVIEYSMDEDKLKDFVREEIEYSVNDRDDEQVADDCIDAGIVESHEVYDETSDVEFPELRDDVDFDDLREKLIESELNDIDDYYQYLLDMGYEMTALYDYIDEDKAVECIKDEIEVNSSRGQEIATYDGDENEEGDFYIYRID